jgi:hypothetical protein
MGVMLAIVVHMIVAAFGLRAGAAEGNISRSLAAQTENPHDEEILEGALLRQGGGGMYDPRTIHRQAPVRAEERAVPQAGLSKNRNEAPSDAGPRRDPTALVTSRDILGTGNQDLAERLQRLAQTEAEADPNAPQGPGSPDGSVHGTETDPNRAGTGAHAKIRSFLEHELHLLSTAPATARRVFRLRIVISEDGTSIARGQVVEGSGDESTDSDLTLQLAQLAENHTTIPDLSDEEKTAIAHHSYVVRYNPR